MRIPLTLALVAITALTGCATRRIESSASSASSACPPPRVISRRRLPSTAMRSPMVRAPALPSPEVRRTASDGRLPGPPSPPSLQLLRAQRPTVTTTETGMPVTRGTQVQPAAAAPVPAPAANPCGDMNALFNTLSRPATDCCDPADDCCPGGNCGIPSADPCCPGGNCGIPDDTCCPGGNCAIPR
ncbi:MAG: hypothetical protein ACYTG6_09180 [Planctomycetota bacterium]|jgi:hypothetical protein